MDAHQVTGFVIWLTGMAGAGKTTLGNQIVKRFGAAGRAVEFLDGDDADEILVGGLGVSKDDRDTAVRRLGAVAKMLARHGAVVVVASLSPFRDARDAIRRDVRRFVEVFVDAPMETLLARDADGLYKKALAHVITIVAGIDDPFEPPSHPELVVRTDQEKPDVATSRLFQKLVDLKLLAPAEFVKLSGGQRPKRPAKPPKKGAAKKPAASKGARAAKRSRR